jgi:hypothetical protein
MADQEKPPVAPGQGEQAQPNPFDFGDPEDTAPGAAAPPGGTAQTPGREADPIETLPEEIPGETRPPGDAGISADDLQRAQAYGLSHDDAQALHQAGMLDKTLTAFDYRLVRNVQELQGQPQPTPQPQGQQQADEPPKFLPDLGTDMYDESLVKALSTMDQNVGKFVKPLVQRLAQLEAAQADQINRQYEQRMDGMFDALGADFAGDFGKGPLRGLNPVGVEARRRIEVTVQMNALRQAYDAHGIPVPSEHELFRRAVRVVAADTADKAAERRLGEQLKTQRGQFVGRPGGRTEMDTRSPLKRAAAKLAAGLRQAGMTPDSAEDDANLL